jgi:hypothetical protein
MQNKKSKKKDNKNKHSKKIVNQGKFRKSAPVGESKDKHKTQKDVHVSKSQNDITKVINKSIESQMVQRAKTGNEQLSILKS